MYNTLCLALVPPSFVILLGWLSARLAYLKKEQASVLGTLVMKFALPLALLAGVLKLPFSELPRSPYILCLATGFMGIYLIAFLLGRFLFRNDLASSAIQALLCAFPSMAFSGVPILGLVIGSRGLIPVLVGNMVTSFVMIPLTLILIQMGTSAKGKGISATIQIALESTVHAAKEPIVWLPIAGIVLNLFGIHPPEALQGGINLMGNSSAGVGCFVLGLMLYGSRFRMSTELCSNVAIKNVAQPLLIAALIPVFGITASNSRELILIGAIPVATTVSIIALRTEKYKDETIASTLAGTVLSIFTVALVIVLTR
jgi:malonate transporter